MNAFGIGSIPFTDFVNNIRSPVRLSSSSLSQILIRASSLTSIFESWTIQMIFNLRIGVCDSVAAVVYLRGLLGTFKTFIHLNVDIMGCSIVVCILSLS